MSAPLKFRFRWRAKGQAHHCVVEAPSYPEACYALAIYHAGLIAPDAAVPVDFELDLSKPERVE